MSRPPLNTSAAALIFGPSKSGKTRALASIAEYVARNYAKRTLYYSFDEGGWPDDMQLLIDAGVVRVCRLTTIDPGGKRNLAMGIMDQASKGYWPARVSKDGQVLSSKMLPPFVAAWTLLCPALHEVLTTESKTDLVPQPCPTCKTMVTQGSGFVREARKPANHMVDAGAVLYDSIQGACQWCMDEQNYLSATGKLGGSTDGRGGGRTPVTSAGIMFGSAGMTSYGQIQMRPRDWSRNSSQIPGLVVPATWTSLDQRVTPEDQKPVIGPMLIGQAATGKAPAWFGMAIYAAYSNEQYRLHLRQFEEDDGKAGTTYLCGGRAIAGSLPAFLADPPGTLKPVECSMGRLFDLLHEAKQKAAAGLDFSLPPLPEDEMEGLMDFTPSSTNTVVAASLPATAAAVAAPRPALPGIPPPKPRTQGPAALPPPKKPLDTRKKD